MQLPDGANSRALLIGTAAYEHLPGVPASRNNLPALANALERHTGLPREHCTQLLDARDLATVGREVEAAVKGATDLLLIYYSGHGLVASDGLLHLALPQTSQQSVDWSGIPFKLLHHAIQVSRARTKVLILDCCFSGRATQLLGAEEGNILGQITANGAYTLTSSPANSPSYAFDGDGHTAFTGALLNLLDNGIPSAGSLLTLKDLYLGLLHHAQAHGLPEPQRLGTHTADMLPLAANRGFPALTLAEDDRVKELAAQMAAIEQLIEANAKKIEATEKELASKQAELAAMLNSPTPSVSLLTARDIEHVRFRTVRFIQGYDRDQVDEFLGKVALALDDPEDGPQRMRAVDVLGARFSLRGTRMREGYDIDEVTSFLDRVQLEFERREGLGTAQGGPY
jgi:DivIVA domain-containing protein